MATESVGKLLKLAARPPRGRTIGLGCPLRDRRLGRSERCDSNLRLIVRSSQGFFALARQVRSRLWDGGGACRINAVCFTAFGMVSFPFTAVRTELRLYL